MSNIDVDVVLREELGNIAPEIDLKAVDAGADLREALEYQFHGLSQFHYRNPSSPRHRHPRSQLP